MEINGGKKEAAENAQPSEVGASSLAKTNEDVKTKIASKSGDDAENEDEEVSGPEEAEEVVMRSEIAVAITDTALPTAEEVQEFEKFSSKS